MAGLLEKFKAGPPIFNPGQSAPASPFVMSPKKEDIEFARMAFDRARAAMASGDNEQAEQMFTLANKVAPHKDAVYNIARAQELQGKAQEAASTFKRYISAGGAEGMDHATYSDLQQRITGLEQRDQEPEIVSPPEQAQPPAPMPDQMLRAAAGMPPLPAPPEQPPVPVDALATQDRWWKQEPAGPMQEQPQIPNPMGPFRQ